ncbi:hypothetical protein ACWCOP_09460 [Maricaulaceae bacterium MS644]
MHILIDLLHLVAAAALSLIGFGYEREEECNPVRFQPAAIVETAELETGESALPGLQRIDNCEADRRALRMPAL